MDGLKTVEARTYELKGYLNEDLWIIETPGRGRRGQSYIGVDGKLTNESDKGTHPRGTYESDKGKHQRGRNPTFVARIIGIVRFGSSFQYTDLAHWRSDRERHRIPMRSRFDWRGPTRDKRKKMYGWRVTSAQALVVPQLVPEKRGMTGCKAITRIAVLKGLRRIRAKSMPLECYGKQVSIREG